MQTDIQRGADHHEAVSDRGAVLAGEDSGGSGDRRGSQSRLTTACGALPACAGHGRYALGRRRNHTHSRRPCGASEPIPARS